MTFFNKMQFSLLDNEKWLEKYTMNPFFITIKGSPGQHVYDIGHYHGEEDEDDEWIEHIERNDKGYFAVDDWGGDTDPMPYDEIIKFIKKNFKSIDTIKITNREEEEEKLNELEREKDRNAFSYALNVLNNKVLFEEVFDQCKHCNHYIPKTLEFCNKYCRKSYVKQNK